MLRRGAPPPLDRLADGLAQIEASALRVATLVDELVEVATLEEGESPPLRPALIDLVELVRQSVQRHQQLDDQHEFVLATAAELFIGFWDEARLARVLDNLLGNGMKYSPASGLITVRVQPVAAEPAAAPIAELVRDQACPSPGVLIAVEDKGIGIDEHDLPHCSVAFGAAAMSPKA